MQTKPGPGILQTENGQRQESITSDIGRKTVRRISTNHRQAERRLIIHVQSGELEIDKQGQIWRVKMRKGVRGGGVQTVDVERRRAEQKVPLGYLQIRAMVDGKRTYGFAHRLVWQHFYGDIPDGLCINHRNGIKDDNRPGNLELVTYSENMKHAFREGLKNQDGERNPNAKLSNAEVEEIRTLYSTEQFYQSDLAKRYNVSFQTISKIIRGERRGAQKGPIDSSDHRLDYMERDPKNGRFVGKKAAGRLLDGRTWSEMPNVGGDE